MKTCAMILLNLFRHRITFYTTIICNLFYCLECLAPLGMENFKITPGQISASSQYSGNHIPNYGRLHFKGNAGAWSVLVRDLNQWIQIDFGIETTVTYVATQGRHNFDQWVTQYKLQYSNDGNTFQVYKQQGENTDKVRL